MDPPQCQAFYNRACVFLKINARDSPPILIYCKDFFLIPPKFHKSCLLSFQEVRSKINPNFAKITLLMRTIFGVLRGNFFSITEAIQVNVFYSYLSLVKMPNYLLALFFYFIHLFIVGLAMRASSDHIYSTKCLFWG